MIKIKWGNVLLAILFEIFLIAFIVSVVKISKWYIDSKSTKIQITTINENISVDEVSDNENTEIINSGSAMESDPYWDFIKTNLIDVDFSKLKSINPDVVGWIQINNTNINYPFVQARDNSYYLTHSFNRSYNEAGWVFVDYRNSIGNEEKNTIIYAHGRLDTTMFGNLRKILTNGWLNNQDNHVIKISTESENTLWQIFSVYRIPTTSDYLKTRFVSDKEFQQFINLISSRSNYNFNTSVSVEDRIITLSTCYNDNDKVVVHAKLIKREKK